MSGSSVSATYKLLEPEDLTDVSDPTKSFSLDVLHGLSGSTKTLPSKYFYDDYGSRLFQQITELEEYYLTRCEREVFRQHREDICRLAGSGPFNLIELGVGDGHKTKILIRELLEKEHQVRFVPIDISEAAVRDLTQGMAPEFPSLEVQGIVSDYFDGIRWLSRFDRQPNLVLFLGSNIGNFHRDEAFTFLRTLWNSLSDGDLVLIGFDLKKSIDVMTQAYNDELGVTREFNLNLLRRINRELGGSFALNKFEHYSTYNVFSGAIESYLVSLEQQSAYVEAIGQSFEFEPFEPIHTEYSYKYLESDIDSLARETGFTPELKLYDSKRWFTDSVWRVHKQIRPE